MTDKHILYGAEFSLYSGKARSYLRYKRIAFDEVVPTRKVYRDVIFPKTGVRFIPVVRTPGGHYLQDTSHIIDTLENAFPQRPVMPAGPCQRLASLLLELYGDEWLLLPALHYRWNFNNLQAIHEQFGAMLFPGLPRIAQRAMGKRAAKRIRSAVPKLGITPVNREAIEVWYEREFLATLDRHLASHDFLFGGAPTIGDFGLMGPLYAHLYRDPYPGKLMRRAAPHVVAWVERMNQSWDCTGELLPDDKVPDTLTPIFTRLFSEHWPVLTDTAVRLAAWAQKNPGAKVPRHIGKHFFTINSVTEERAVLPYSLWKMQRPLDCYRTLAHTEKDSVDAFLRRIGGYDALNFRSPIRVTRIENQISIAPVNDIL